MLQGKLHESVYRYRITGQNCGCQALGNIEVIATCLADLLGRVFPLFAMRNPFTSVEGCHEQRGKRLSTRYDDQVMNASRN